jgi:beta-glucosidase
MLVIPPPASDIDSIFASGADLSDPMILAKGLPPFQIHYDERLEVGYKWYDAERKDTLFPFGFGVSYTGYEYSGLRVRTGKALQVSFTVRNTGPRAGTEVAQVYASLPASAGEPPKRLIGWARVALAAGESKPIALGINRDRLSIFDAQSDGWKLVTGGYRILVGSSSRNLPLSADVTLHRFTGDIR